MQACQKLSSLKMQNIEDKVEGIDQRLQNQEKTSDKMEATMGDVQRSIAALTVEIKALVQVRNQANTYLWRIAFSFLAAFVFFVFYSLSGKITSFFETVFKILF
jgi:septal ring factor EnvC (AmiA/AmiB activator)